MKRAALNILGFTALICGALGVVLPLLPTTPFVLLAAWCFGAANPAMYQWLLSNKYFGEYIRNYREGGGISNAARARAIVFLWAALMISGALMFSNPYALIVLGFVGAGVTVHLLRIPRKR